jgi:secondary thiamine-phosphate synthase enzyme
MKSYTEHLWFSTKNRVEFINITGEVQELVDKSGIREGLVLVNAMHITASVYINDAESGLINDFQKWLLKLAPTEKNLYKHNLTGEDNAYAHLWRTIMGREVVCAITNGKLDFGPWERYIMQNLTDSVKKELWLRLLENKSFF